MQTGPKVLENLMPIERDDWPVRLRQGEVQRDLAIEELRNILLRGLSRSLSHRYGGSVQVEDVVQEALIKILASLDTFQGRSKFTTWAMSIATRVGISKLRRHYYRDVSLDQHLGGQDFRIDIAVIESESLATRESRAAMLQLLQKLIDESLSDKQRQAIRGTLEGLPIEEIAERLHSNRNAVYKLVHDARLRLRKEFEACGITSDDLANAIS
jgi:RNA polymerase sigma-70 factor (ECF subfamily)